MSPAPSIPSCGPCPGIACSSPNQAPRSSNRQRLLQNGRQTADVDQITVSPQVGQRTRGPEGSLLIARALAAGKQEVDVVSHLGRAAVDTRPAIKPHREPMLAAADLRIHERGRR